MQGGGGGDWKVTLYSYHIYSRWSRCVYIDVLTLEWKED